MLRYRNGYKTRQGSEIFRRSEGDLVSVSGVLCKVEAVMTVYNEDSDGYKMALAAAQCIPDDIITLSEYYKRKELEVDE